MASVIRRKRVRLSDGTNVVTETSAIPPKPATTAETKKQTPQAEKRPATSEPLPIPDGYFDAAFLDNLAHQLVAPLQCIENHCQNLIEGRVDGAKINTRLKEIVGHARITIALAQRMRFLHRLVSGAGEEGVIAEKVTFHRIVSQWIDAYNNYLPALQARGITVDIDLTMNELPDVNASPLAVQQVIMNLFDNAAKYAEERATIIVSGKVKSRFVEVSFSHRGLRVPDAERERIFERGFRSSEVNMNHAPGTGIGLWVCRRLMEAMGGTIACIPAGRDGSTEFRIRWRVT